MPFSSADCAEWGASYCVQRVLNCRRKFAAVYLRHELKEDYKLLIARNFLQFV